MKKFAAYLLAIAVNTLLAEAACIGLVILLEPISMILALASAVAATSVFGYVHLHLLIGISSSLSNAEEEV